MTDIPHFPLSAVVGADDLKLALYLTAIDPKIGGVLIEGPRDLAAVALGNSIWVPVFLLMSGILLAVCGGLALSWFKDTPAGPSIVVCAAALFLLSFVLPRRGV